MSKFLDLMKFVFMAMIAVACISSSVLAQDYVDITRLDEASITSRLNGMQVLDSNSPLGDSVNLDMGSLSFSYTDISLSGNSALPVAFGRSYAVDGADIADNIYGGWNPEVPYITAKVTLSDQYGLGMTWSGGDCMHPPNRLTQGEAGSDEALRSANAFWQGVSMHIPGEGDKLLLSGRQPSRSSVEGVSLNQGTSQDTAPIFTGGPLGTSSQLRTRDHWTLACLDNSNVGAVAHAPNGWKYYFDHVTLTRAGDRNLLRLLRSTDPRGVPYHCTNAGPRSNCLSFGPQNVDNLNVMATRIEDQNGNWVEYDYDGMRLKSITSNDGRRIGFTYESVSYNTPNFRDKSGFRLKTINANGRSWSFNYSIIGVYSHLKKITLPDKRTWEYDLPPMKVKAESYVCYRINRGGVDPKIYTVKGPSGLLATYNLELRRFGKSGIPKRDLLPAPTGFPTSSESCDDNKIPKFSVSRALVSKTYNVLDGDTDTWQYRYQDDEGYFLGAGLSGPAYDLRRSEMIDPEGNRTVSFYNRRFQSDDEGLVSRREYFDGATGERLQTNHIEYDKGPAMGNSTVLFSLAPPIAHSRPVKKTTIERNNDIFTTEIDYNLNPSSSNYSFGNPTETRSWSNYVISNESNKRIITTTYEHKKDKWILGLPKTVTRNGRQLSKTDYDALGQPLKRYQYNQTTPIAEYTYHSDGTMASVTDALGRVTEAYDWHRGKPERVELAVGTNLAQSIKRELDDNGWITSQTDAKNRKTKYQHDSMGRLTRITPHTPAAGQGFKMPDTSIVYTFRDTKIIQMITTGPKRDFVYYDTMLRPFLELTYDFKTAKRIYTRTRYDALGRPIFKSHPSSSSNEANGVETEYDGLGRVTQTRENVAPYATTTHEYLSYHRKKVTDPERHAVTTYQYGWDGPDSGVPYLIRQHGITDTWVRRNVHGEITRVDQNGTSGGFNVNEYQHFYYDSNRRLCRSRTAEGGDSEYQYNEANEMIAYGKSTIARNSCRAPSGNTKVSMTYDDLGRLKDTLYTDPNTPDISRDYDVSGNITKLYRGSGASAVNWDYLYDGNDMLKSEELTIAGAPQGFDIRYLYNAHGHMYRKYLPSGKAIRYDTDGLGRDTKVSWGSETYAENASYHRSGALESLDYGNGTSFTQTLNARLLPERLKVTKNGTDIQSLYYDYYADGRIKHKLDGVDSTYSAIHFYDSAGRLERANSSAWGGATYTYDALGNLREKRISNWNGAGSRTVTNNYNSRNQIASSIDTANIAYGFGYDTRGNVTQTGGLSFTYDMSNQPVAMSGRAPNTGTQVDGTYLYDGNMKRVKSVVNGKTIYNVYDAAGRLVHVDEEGGGETDYLHGMGQTLARIKDGEFTYLHPDHLGSPQVGTNEAGAVAFNEYYTPFGEALINAAANDNQSGFTGHIKDKSTGLNYMQARYYDPNIGRFLSIDPVTFMDTGNPSFFNRYRYCANDPVNCTDPTGMVDFSILAELRAGASIGQARASVNTQEASGRAAVVSMAPGVGVVTAIAGGAGAGGIATAVAMEVPLAKPLKALKMVNPKALKATQPNAALNNSQVKRMTKDMKQNGFDQSKPVSVSQGPDGTQFLEDGHHRATAAGKAGIKEIPANVTKVDATDANKLTKEHLTSVAEDFGNRRR